MSDIQPTDPISLIEIAIAETIKAACPQLSAFERVGGLTEAKYEDSDPPFGYVTWQPSAVGPNEDALDGGAVHGIDFNFLCRFKFGKDGGKGSHAEAYPILWTALQSVLGMIPIPGDPSPASPLTLVSLAPQEEDARWIWYGFGVSTRMYITIERSEYDS